jgi:ClpP class serine protease
LAALRGEFYAEPGPVGRIEPEPKADVTLVRIDGVIKQHAGSEGPSGSYVDGQDAICERLSAAFEMGDAVLCIDSPGGAVAGGPENIRRVQEMKAKHGRRCTVHTEALCASMALWWALAIGDAFYVSRDGRAGSIGARGALGSIVGALAKEGIDVEIIEDPDGKACGAPERPIDEEARARAQAEVTAAADMFRAAVCESAVGKRHGLTPDALKAMRGKIYQGEAAVAAGLADGVATLEDVLTEALAMAGEGATAMPEPDEKKDPEKNDDEPEEEAMTCGTCGDKPVGKGRFCAGCGAKMPGDDGAPDSDRPGAAPPMKDEGKATAAHYAGLSLPALRAAAITMHRTLDAVSRHVGAKAHGEILGCVEAVAKDAANAARYRTERNAASARADERERIDILMSLAAADPKGHPRGNLLVDVVQDGKIVGVKPAKLWGDGPEGRTLQNLRGYSRTVLSAAPAQEQNPYDRPPPDADPKAATAQAGEPTPGEIEAAKRDPAVLIAAQTTPGANLDALARQHVLVSRAARRAQVPA